MSIDLGGSAKPAIKLLDDSNYFNWSFRIETILKHKGLWKTISDTRPTEAEQATAWDKNDQEALTCMRLSIGDDQIKHIRNIDTAKAAWNAPKEVHEHDTPSNKIRLLREIVGKVAHEGDNIQAHLDGMVEKFQRLTAMGELNTDFLNSALLLNSLPKSYDSLVLALETRSADDFNVNVVKSIICEEYRRRTARDCILGRSKFTTVFRQTTRYMFLLQETWTL